MSLVEVSNGPCRVGPAHLFPCGLINNYIVSWCAVLCYFRIFSAQLDPRPNTIRVVLALYCVVPYRFPCQCTFEPGKAKKYFYKNCLHFFYIEKKLPNNGVQLKLTTLNSKNSNILLIIKLCNTMNEIINFPNLSLNVSRKSPWWQQQQQQKFIANFSFWRQIFC